MWKIFALLIKHTKFSATPGVQFKHQNKPYLFHSIGEFKGKFFATPQQWTKIQKSKSMPKNSQNKERSHFVCPRCNVKTLDQKRLEMHYIMEHYYCLKCSLDLKESKFALKHWKMHENPLGVTKCRFCTLNLHLEEGWMACEHFAVCDFTTKSFQVR